MSLDADEIALLNLLLSQLPVTFGDLKPTLQFHAGKLTAAHATFGDATIRVTLSDVRKAKAQSLVA